MSYQSMRESSISGRLRALSSDAGPKEGNKTDKVAVVERTGPKVAEEVLHTEGKTVAPRADRMPRKAGGRTLPKHDDKAQDMKMMTEGHPDEKQDKAMIRKMVKSDALTGKKAGGRAAYAGGGKVKSKGSTTINIVMPVGGGDKPDMPPAMPMPAGMAAPMPRPAPQMPPAPPVSPTLALKTGGRAMHFTAGAGSGEGRLEKTEHAKARK